MRGILAGTAALTAAIVVAGCSGGGGGGGSTNGGKIDALPPAALDTSAAVMVFAQSSSMPNAFTAGFLPYIAISLSSDTSCPARSTNGDTTTYTGGCTDANGNTYGGTLIAKNIQGTSPSDGGLTYQGFSIGTATTCGSASLVKFDGAMTTHASGAIHLDLGLDIDGYADGTCDPETGFSGYVFDGTVAQQGSNGTLWTGTGKVGYTATGAITQSGKSDVSTQSELIDDGICNSEAASGSTTFSAGGHSAVVTYDGATDCSPSSTVTWSYDGTNQGTLAGVQCDVASTTGRLDALALGLFAATLGLALARRRGA